MFAAAAPKTGLVAIRALCDKGHIQPGRKVLINGTSGGIGTFATPNAKALGAEVTGVCGARNTEMTRTSGAMLVRPDKDLDSVMELIESGKVSTVINWLLPLSEIAEALRHYGEGHSRGEVIITVEDDGNQEATPQKRRFLSVSAWARRMCAPSGGSE